MVPKKTLSEIEQSGGEAFIQQADVSTPEEVKAMFRNTIEKYGTVDILVNNAGIQQDAPFLEMEHDEWQKVINVNLSGAILLRAQEAAKEFVRRGVVEERSRAAGKNYLYKLGTRYYSLGRSRKLRYGQSRYTHVC